MKQSHRSTLNLELSRLNIPDTRASLIVRLKDAADTAAWQEVVSIYGPLIYRLAQRQGLQEHDADDVVQEVFTAVSRSVQAWLDQEQRGKFRNWLFGITKRIAINALLRRPIASVGLGGEAANLLQLIPDKEHELMSQVELEYEREVYRWASAKVRAQVTEATWLAFHLTHVEGLEISKVATDLGMSVGNVYIARSRVMSRLRDVAKRFEVQS